MSCAAGFEMNGYVCSDDMFVDSGAPAGWFQAACPVTCGTGCPERDPCDDDDDAVMFETDGGIPSCAAGFEMNGFICSEDMFVNLGAPPGGFQALCPVTCGTGCSGDVELDPVCGCEEAGRSYCNYDFGDSGFCEACSDPGAGADVSGGNWGCYNRGLPDAGAADCVKWCTAPPVMPPPPPEPEPWYQGYCSQDVGPTACAYCSARSCAERTGDYTACVLLTEADVTVLLTDVSDGFAWAS